MGSKHRVDTKDKKRTRKNAEFGREKRNSGNQELSNEPEKDTIMEGDEAEEDEQNSSSDESSKIIDNEQSDAEEDDDEEEEDDDFPRKKKSKNSKHDDGSTGFSAAVNAILSSHLKAYDRKDPIMARNKKVLKQSESEKLEYKAKKALLAEKKKLLGKARKTDIIPIASGEDRSENIRKVLEKETALRKIAQKGAVKLFNAILATQVKTEKEVSENLSGIKNKEEKKELITEVSKEKFLDLVKAAAGSDNE
ncbi:AAR_G0057020.mRNA.1.CDS.1 [Saccharomyces cerevisiae]|uniref:Pre-60S ribosomal particles component n=1 Tax=Saccharomyces pastorianus TaxID=27292 RepID=A0A6C1E275_SACPS|nr:Rrp15p [Saccharomyces cerevisiae YJM1477]AJV93370.1 Rrp15p [Saccharomyces cerevisiae YJM1526]AJV93810.1 Rrp15p [Saccharomyces cerevisiae YJM1527]AJV94077.1 Rrp15p [Saccharomyces cerevisiae YJM1549]AJV94786.1 Rrp15p [Saccharomyces cerevisiae YJM1574]AJV96349.1 Rrp15p [Saccharomyces cerevisiae YJM193]AJV98534.1 Rrp15p [Saccharomyces cerevisiae YJM271]AJV98969.1 Rrp15p [Saccharomyces cerevisiae YJM320]AJV99409.1 Rrp15p [Saccharomyces cerevisiae YJM326]AJW02856.1 Rrp15p [Saccharomyces cerev